MKDQYKRNIDYLRISLTDRCNLHCRYCQPEVACHVSHEQILRYEELLRICRAAVRLGMNISLDTTDAQQYRELTGGEIKTVFAGLAEARAASLPFKLNCVPLAGLGFDGVRQLLKLAEEYQAPLRFIELMPLACNGSLQGISGSALRQLWEQYGLQVTRDEQVYGNGPASYYRLSGYSVPVGFIEPIHNRFCAACNRVRLTSVGFLKTCLYSAEGLDLAALLRSGADEEELEQALQQTIWQKPWGHKFDVSPAQFNMSQIGG